MGYSAFKSGRVDIVIRDFHIIVLISSQSLSAQARGTPEFEPFFIINPNKTI